MLGLSLAGPPAAARHGTVGSGRRDQRRVRRRGVTTRRSPRRRAKWPRASGAARTPATSSDDDDDRRRRGDDDVDDDARRGRAGLTGSAPRREVRAGRVGRQPEDQGQGDRAGSDSSRRIARFFREVVAELRKVIWPTRKELLTYTAVVVVFVTVMLTIVAGLDFGFAKGVLWVFGNRS